MSPRRLARNAADADGQSGVRTPRRSGVALEGPTEPVVLTVLGAATVAFALMQSLLIPALPAIQRSLNASPAATAWAVTGFLISAVVATPIAGKLGDTFGRRRVLVSLLVIVCVGTSLCATFASLPALIIGRVIQGVGGGVLPLAYSIVRDELRAGRVPHGVALVSSALAAGGAVGVLLSGVVVEHHSYTWLFWLQLPVFALVAWCARTYLSESSATSRGGVDWRGAALLSAGLALTLLAITQAHSWGPWSPATVLVSLGATVSLVLWIRSALRRREPLVDLRLMKRRAMWTTNLTALLVGIGQFSSFLLLPQYVQEPTGTGYGFGASAFGAGLFLLPLTATAVLAGLMVGRLERRFGAKRLLIAGIACFTGSFLLLTLARTAPWQVYAASALNGIGIGLAFATLATLIVSNVQQTETGVATGVNNVSRTMGNAVGAQLATALLAASAGSDDMPTQSGYTLAFCVGLLSLTAALALSPLLPPGRTAAARRLSRSDRHAV
jgi:EmrB/QacA subfamily drug resistance transporter